MSTLLNIPERNECGVYEIINVRTKRKYIGSSGKLRTRAITHFSGIKNINHQNYLINSDAKNNDNFEFHIIHVVNSENQIESIAKARVLEYEEMKKMIESGESLYNLENIRQVNYQLQKYKNNLKAIENDELNDRMLEGLKLFVLSNPIEFFIYAVDTFKSEDLQKIFEALEIDAEITYKDRKTGKEIFKSKI